MVCQAFAGQIGGQNGHADYLGLPYCALRCSNQISIREDKRRFQGICPQACGFGVGFHPISLAHRRDRSVSNNQWFAHHIANIAAVAPNSGVICGNGGTVADGQASCALAKEFDKCTNHALFTQEFGQCQHDVGGSNARLAFAGQLNADNIRQTRIMEARPNITVLASNHPHLRKSRPRIDARRGCESVPTQVSGNATPFFLTWTTGRFYFF